MADSQSSINSSIYVMRLLLEDHLCVRGIIVVQVQLLVELQGNSSFLNCIALCSILLYFTRISNTGVITGFERMLALVGHMFDNTFGVQKPCPRLGYNWREGTLISSMHGAHQTDTISIYQRMSSSKWQRSPGVQFAM